MPAWPQPITITGAAALTSSAISSPQAMARGSTPSNCRSSNNIGRSRSGTVAPARKDISSRRSSGERGWGSHPASRYSAMTGRAARKIPARWSSVSPHWNCVEVAGWGNARSRIHDGSPVMCTSEHSRAGALRSSSFVAMTASSSVNGTPACGFRSAATSTGADRSSIRVSARLRERGDH